MSYAKILKANVCVLKQFIPYFLHNSYNNETEKI